MNRPELGSFEDVQTTFLDMEADLELFALRVDDVPVWERIRVSIQQAVFEGLFHFGDEPETNGSLRSWTELGRTVAAAAGPKNPFLQRRRDVLVYGHNRRQRRDDGTYWDIYTDPLYCELNLDYLHLEIPHKGRHYRPPRTEHLGYLDGIRYIGALRRRLGSYPKALPGDVRNRLRDVEAWIRSEFDMDVPVLGQARDSLGQRRSTLRLYELLLKWHDPELALVVVSYGKETFIEACRRCDVPVVELQHGVITPYHLGYSYPAGRTKEMAPDRLLAFGSYWTETVSLPDRTRVTSVGYPYLEALSEEYASSKTHNRVIFVSQDNHVGVPLSKTAVDFARKVDTNLEVVYKLHPEEYQDWTERYPWLTDSNVTISGLDGPSIYELFGTSRAVVGVYSTALFEALNFDLPVYALEEPGIAYLRDLIELDAVTVVTSAADLVAELEGESPTAIDTDRFFEPDAIHNIRRVLAEYLE